MPVAAHAQRVTRSYVVAYPDHEPREGDPHYVDFRAWKDARRGTPAWRCAWAVQAGDDGQCDAEAPLEAHHAHIEFALLNAVSFAALEHAYPGISDPAAVGAWIESDANLVLLCRRHHVGLGAGVHDLDSAMFEASHYLRPGTVSAPPAATPPKERD